MGERLNSVQSGAGGAAADTKIIVRLKIGPELHINAKTALQAQSRISGNRALGVNNGLGVRSCFAHLPRQDRTLPAHKRNKPPMPVIRHG